jgi:hypothetical protein
LYIEIKMDRPKTVTNLMSSASDSGSTATGSNEDEAVDITPKKMPAGVDPTILFFDEEDGSPQFLIAGKIVDAEVVKVFGTPQYAGNPGNLRFAVALRNFAKEVHGGETTDFVHSLSVEGFVFLSRYLEILDLSDREHMKHLVQSTNRLKRRVIEPGASYGHDDCVAKIKAFNKK